MNKNYYESSIDYLKRRDNCVEFEFDDDYLDFYYGNDLESINPDQLTQEQYYDLCKIAIIRSHYKIDQIKHKYLTKEQLYKLYIIFGNTHVTKPLESEHVKLLDSNLYYKLCKKLRTRMAHLEYDLLTNAQVYKLLFINMRKTKRPLFKLESSKVGKKVYYNLCEFSVENHESAIKDVCYRSLTEEQRFELLKLVIIRGYNLTESFKRKWVKDELYYKLSKISIERDSEHIKLVVTYCLEKEHYSNLCEYVIKRSHHYIQDICPHSMTQERYYKLCKYVLNKEPKYIIDIQAKKLSLEQYLELCQISAEKGHVPVSIESAELLGSELYSEIFKTALQEKKHSNIEHLRLNFITPTQYYELCKILIVNNVDNIVYINHYYLSEEQCYEICRIVLSKIWYALKVVPEDLITLEMCLIAVSQDVRALEFVPKRFQHLFKR